MRHEGKIFSSHEARTKPFVSRSHPSPGAPPAPAATPIRTHTPSPPAPVTLPPAARAFIVSHPHPDSHHHPRWDAAKRLELSVFDAFDCKTTFPASAVPRGEQIFDFLWRCTYKADRGNGKPPARARFCIAGDREWNKENDVPTSPVSPHRAIRTAMAVASILNWRVQTEDFLRAYLQSDALAKPVYVHAPPKADEPPSSVWVFSRPMYGKGNAGRHFHFSTQNKFLTIPGLELSSVFDTVYFSPRRGCLSSYVDDTLTAGTSEFEADVASILRQYKTHTPDHDTIRFAGIAAYVDADGLHCHGRPYTDALLPLDAPTPMTTPLAAPAALHSLAAQILWVGRVARPDVLTNATQLVNCPNPTSLDARRANDTLAILTNRAITLHFPRLDPDSLRLSVYADYCGSTLSPMAKRQVGYIIALTDASRRISLLHWASHRPHRVWRGSTAGQMLALADAVAASLDVRHLLQELLSTRVPLDAYTDSATAYELVTSFKDPAGMSGKNDLYMLRRALLSGTLAEFNHVHGHANPAEALFKPTFSRPPLNGALADALRTGLLHTPVVAHTTTDGYRSTPHAGIDLHNGRPPAPAGTGEVRQQLPDRPPHPRQGTAMRHHATAKTGGTDKTWSPSTA